MKKSLLVFILLFFSFQLLSAQSSGINIPQLNQNLTDLDGYLNSIEQNSNQQDSLLSQQKKTIENQQKSLESSQNSIKEISSQLATLDLRCQKLESKSRFWKKCTITLAVTDVIAAGVIYGLIRFR